MDWAGFLLDGRLNHVAWYVILSFYLFAALNLNSKLTIGVEAGWCRSIAPAHPQSSETNCFNSLKTNIFYAATFTGSRGVSAARHAIYQPGFRPGSREQPFIRPNPASTSQTRCSLTRKVVLTPPLYGSCFRRADRSHC